MRFPIAFLALWLTLSPASGAEAPARPEGRPTVLAIHIDNVVHPITVEIVSRAIDQTKAQKASALLVRLNTPGGLMEASRQIVEKLIASPVPVITYVTPSGGRAASAGFVILEAGDIAAMAPGTNTGAASPVLLSGEMDATMRQKVQNDLAASLRSLTSKRGRNSQMAEQAVFQAKSYTEKEALDNKLVDIVATNEDDLFRQLNGRQISRFDGRRQTLELASASIAEYEKTTRERILSAISDPNLALILLVLGALGVYVEFSSPGLIVPGVLGAILALLGLSALAVLPISWLGASLLVLAVALFVLEAKFASHGILGAGGAVAMVLGALLLIESPFPEMRIHLSTAIAITLPFALITVFLLSLVIRARANKVATGSAGMIEEIGIAHTQLSPSGKVFIHGEFWDAVASTPVEPGARVKVTDVQGLTLKVEPVHVSTAGELK